MCTLADGTTMIRLFTKARNRRRPTPPNRPASAQTASAAGQRLRAQADNRVGRKAGSGGTLSAIAGRKTPHGCRRHQTGFQPFRHDGTNRPMTLSITAEVFEMTDCARIEERRGSRGRRSDRMARVVPRSGSFWRSSRCRVNPSCARGRADPSAHGKGWSVPLDTDKL